MHKPFTLTPAQIARQREDQRLSATVECVGFVVQTIVTNNDGHVSYQHSPIYRTREQAERIAAKVGKRQPWERSIERRVEIANTAFPLADVLEGKATCWEAYLASEAGLARKEAA